MVVSVVYGGTPEERGPSEENAAEIAAALKSRGYQVHLMAFDKDILSAIRAAGTDVVFLCVQGKGYGDGTLQAMLDAEGIPYTGSPMRAACLINDKILCKLVYDRYKIPTPRWEILTEKAWAAGDFDFEAFGYPFVAKAPTQGGSFGIELIRSPRDLDRIGRVFVYDDPILIERFIDGRYFTVGLYEGRDGLVILPPMESMNLDHPDPLKPGPADDSGREVNVFIGHYGARPADLDKGEQAGLMKIAEQVFEATGARGYSRVDFMLAHQDHTPYVLENNAVPGLKKASLFPQEADLAGIVYEDMIEEILQAALKREGSGEGGSQCLKT